jgi:hypothetical protein
MSLLSKPKHERFAQLVARGETARRAYVAAYGSAKGAEQSASRLLRNAKVSARIGELRAQISSKLLDEGIRSVNFRVETLENGLALLEQRRQWLSDSIDQLRAERGEALKDETPGGATGLLVHDYKGLSGNLRDVYRVDSGLASLLGELRAVEEEIRAHMEQAARELGEWTDKVKVEGGDLVARLAAGRQRAAKLKRKGARA